MKLIYLALLTTCFLSPHAARAQHKTDRDRAGLIGPVKSVDAYITDFPPEGGKTEPGKRRPWHSAAYNSEGNHVERVSYNPAGEISTKYVHTFDAKGRSTGYEEYSASLDKTLKTPRRHVYTLDDGGNRVEYRVYESDASASARFTYKYDARGNKIEDGYYYHTGLFGGKTVYTYDDKGNQTGNAAYNADGAINWRNVSAYDGRGRRIEWLQYQGDKLRYKITSAYDDKGRVLEEETTEFNGTPNTYTSHAPEPGKIVYAYDDGKRTKEVAAYGPGGALRSRIVYTHDERGSEVGRAAFKADGSREDESIHFFDNIQEPASKHRGTLTGETLFEVEYDSRGNWTKKTYLIRPAKGGDLQPYRAEQRVITYH